MVDQQAGRSGYAREGMDHGHEVAREPSRSTCTPCHRSICGESGAADSSASRSARVLRRDPQRCDP
jgi:hypothetical protein